jgi:hypothetical protein
MNTFSKYLQEQELDVDIDDVLPDNLIQDIEKNIRDGAKDLEQQWANALELTSRAYTVAGLKSPIHKDSPIKATKQKQWGQFMDLTKYAVEQLNKTRGRDGEWRISDKLKGE